MSNELKDPQGVPTPPNDWPRWYREMCSATLDHEAVTEDLLRPPWKRDLGIREAKRLYRDARDKLARLLALGGGSGGGGDDGDGGDEGRGDPAGLGGSPAD